MLTQRNSSLVNRLKYLLVFPVLAGSILCCGQVVSQTGNGREWKGNKVTYKGNVFAFNTPRADTVITLNPVTGKEAMMVTHPDSYPEQMNGHKIYNAQSVDQMPRYRNGTLNEALFQVVQKDLDQLKDGEYTLKISDIVIDQSGKLVYYNKPDLFSKPGSTQPSPQVLQQVAAKIEAYLDRNPEFDPALLNGQPAIVTTAFEQRVIVKDHRAMPYNDQQ